MPVALTQVPATLFVWLRQVPSGLPAACWHVLFVPSHRSVVQTLPSSVHAVPLAFFASAGHVAPEPGQLSATSHSPLAERQTVVEGWKLSAGHAVLVPVHVSATSQAPADARQTAPALPAGWVQVVLVPSQTSVV